VIQTALSALVAANPVPAPWWGVPVVAGSFLLGGAILGFLFNRANDKRRAKLEADIRWHELVRTLTAGILAHSPRLSDLARYNYELDGEGFDDSVPIKARANKAVADEKAAMYDKANEIAIIAPASLSKAVFQYVSHVSLSISPDTKTAAKGIAGQRESRTILMQEVRKYLGLSPDFFR